MQPINLTINGHTSKSELCEIGERTATDKSPYNPGHFRNERVFRHSYTPVYSMLFAPWKNKEINLGEVGILQGGSLRLWREYFTKAHLFAYDFYWEWLNMGLALNLPDTKISYLDVTIPQTMTDAFGQVLGGFDIFIDDSTHQFDDQIRVIHAAWPFVKSGGIMVVEDIFRSTPEAKYTDALADITSQFDFFAYLDVDHDNRTMAGWELNDKLLYIVKR